MQNLWRLEVLVNGIMWRVSGTEEAMRSGYDELKEVMGSAIATDSTLVEVCGMCDSADRADKRIVVRVQDVKALDLTKMY